MPSWARADRLEILRSWKISQRQYKWSKWTQAKAGRWTTPGARKESDTFIQKQKGPSMTALKFWWVIFFPQTLKEWVNSWLYKRLLKSLTEASYGSYFFSCLVWIYHLLLARLYWFFLLSWAGLSSWLLLPTETRPSPERRQAGASVWLRTHTFNNRILIHWVP